VGTGFEEMGREEILRIKGAIASEMQISETEKKSPSMFRGNCME